MTASIAAGDRVLLFDAASGERWLVDAGEAGARARKGLGVFDASRLVGSAWGDAVEVAGRRLHLLRPTAADLHATVRRKAQIITAKDASRIAFELGVGRGDRVLESGIGSAATTVVLAGLVGDGRVVVQELRDDFAAWGRANVDAAGVGDRVDIHVGDLTEALVVDGRFDACLLDQPEPWRALPHVLPALVSGARVAAYCPQVSQMEATARCMRDLGLADVRCLELLERTWEVKERGSRPASEGIGHTAFLVFGRAVSL